MLGKIYFNIYLSIIDRGCFEPVFMSATAFFDPYTQKKAT